MGVPLLRVCSERVGDPSERGKWVISGVKTYQPDSGALFSSSYAVESVCMRTEACSDLGAALDTVRCCGLSLHTALHPQFLANTTLMEDVI